MHKNLLFDINFCYNNLFLDVKKAIFRCKFFVKFSVCVTSNRLVAEIENVQLSVYLSSPLHNIVKSSSF